MSLRLITDAIAEPLTLAQARRHLRIDADQTDEDADISDMIVAARKRAEHETGRALTTQTWELVLDDFPEAEIELGKPSVIAVESVKYIDPDTRMELTMDAGMYVLDRETDPGYLMPVSGGTWPAAFADSTNAVRVRFTTGYLANEDKERALLRRWMLMHIGTMWEHRKTVQPGNLSELPNRFTDGMLDCYKVYSL
jgi:uncharacterized phiE125 gp8 family phage protein